MTGAMATLQQRFDAYVTARPTLALAIRASLLTVIVVSAIYAVWDFGFDWARPEGDPWNYLAAGERLNAGHPLYTLSAGDRPVILRPPFWSVPLLAPPPIAVLWRPLALLGDSSMFLWGFAGLIGVLASALYAARRGAYLLLAVVAQSMALVAISGNASALILPMLIGAWIVRDRPWIVGLLIAAATAVKLTPVVLIVWLIATNRWRAVGATLAWALAIGVVSLVGAGLDSWVAWIESVPSSRPSPVALSTLTGLPTVAVAALLCVPILLAWRRDRLAFAAAIIATALATPALYFTAIALLAAIPIGRDPEDGRWWAVRVLPARPDRSRAIARDDVTPSDDRAPSEDRVRA